MQIFAPGTNTGFSALYDLIGEDILMGLCYLYHCEDPLSFPCAEIGPDFHILRTSWFQQASQPALGRTRGLTLFQAFKPWSA